MKNPRGKSSKCRDGKAIDFEREEKNILEEKSG